MGVRSIGALFSGELFVLFLFLVQLHHLSPSSLSASCQVDLSYVIPCQFPLRLVVSSLALLTILLAWLVPCVGITSDQSLPPSSRVSVFFLLCCLVPV